MATMLRHKATGDLYVYTDLLFKRGDMEMVEDVVQGTEKTEVKPPRKQKAKASDTLPVDLDFDE